MAFHRLNQVVGLALYRALFDEFPDREELVDRIHAILWNKHMNAPFRLVAFLVRRSNDPFERYLRYLGPKNEWLFPCPPWEKVPVEMDSGTGWHQTKCPYKDFLEKEGAVELTRAFCDMDKRIAEYLPDHVDLKRQHRLAAGDDWCDFLYERK